MPKIAGIFCTEAEVDEIIGLVAHSIREGWSNVDDRFEFLREVCGGSGAGKEKEYNIEESIGYFERDLDGRDFIVCWNGPCNDYDVCSNYELLKYVLEKYLIPADCLASNYEVRKYIREHQPDLYSESSSGGE